MPTENQQAILDLQRRLLELMVELYKMAPADGQLGVLLEHATRLGRLEREYGGDVPKRLRPRYTDR